MTPTHRTWTAVPWTLVEHHADQATGRTWDTETPGVEITDPEREVTYRVTLGRGDGQVWLTSLHLVPTDAEPVVDQPALRRVPVAALAAYAAVFLAEQEAAGHLMVVLPGGIELSGALRVPSSEQIAAMLANGETRQTIAARFGRSVSTVADWIGRAYREVPEQMPPRRRGRKPRAEERRRAAERAQADAETSAEVAAVRERFRAATTPKTTDGRQPSENQREKEER